MSAIYASGRRVCERTRFGELPSTIAFKIREPGSALTHFAALLAVSMFAGPLLMKTAASGSPKAVFGMAVFIVSTCLLYAASTIYHTIVGSERVTTILRKIDHVSISIMIAGTYTPICLTILWGHGGALMLAAIWTLAIGGVILKLTWVSCPKWLSSLVYVAMGWMCIFALPEVIGVTSKVMFAELLGGGIFYTAGAIIYAMHPAKFDAKHIYFGSHEIFHVFIMLGTLCHFIFMINLTALL